MQRNSKVDIRKKEVCSKFVIKTFYKSKFLVSEYIFKLIYHCEDTQGHVDVQWTSIERPYWTCGRPNGTFNGRLVDVPNETQLVRPNRTKMDVHFRPSRDAMHGTWTSSGPPPDVG